MEKKVSVIVPVYRTLEWLARCVQSITGQTYKNLEIILVDDGSPDDCPALCDDWATIGEHEKCNRKQQQDSGCGFRRQKRRLAISFVFDKQ